MFIGIPGMSLTITDLINLEGIIYYDIPGIPINIYEQNFLLNGIQYVYNFSFFFLLSQKSLQLENFCENTTPNPNANSY